MTLVQPRALEAAREDAARYRRALFATKSAVEADLDWVLEIVEDRLGRAARAANGEAYGALVEVRRALHITKDELHWDPSDRW